MRYPVIFILFAIVLILICLYILSVKIVLEYALNGLDDSGSITLSLLRDKIKYTFKLPRQKSSKNKTNKKDMRDKKDGFLDKYYNIKEVIAAIKRLRVYLSEKLLLSELKLDVDIGAGDAAYTGILSGVLWAAACSLSSYVENSFTTYKKNINVKPNYKEKKLSIELYCIFNIKLVYIIVVGFKIYMEYLKKHKFKGGDVVE